MTSEPGVNIIDAGAVTVWIASFAQVLPSIAAILSILWFLIRIFESDSVQAMLGKYAWLNKETRHGKDKDGVDGN